MGKSVCGEHHFGAVLCDSFMMIVCPNFLGLVNEKKGRVRLLYIGVVSCDLLSCASCGLAARIAGHYEQHAVTDPCCDSTPHSIALHQYSRETDWIQEAYYSCLRSVASSSCAKGR
jgi:hypothetical protein